MAHRHTEPIPAIKYADSLAALTGRPWGVYQGAGTLFVIAPVGHTDKAPLEVCHPPEKPIPKGTNG